MSVLGATSALTFFVVYSKSSYKVDQYILQEGYRGGSCTCGRQIQNSQVLEIIVNGNFSGNPIISFVKPHIQNIFNAFLERPRTISTFSDKTEDFSFELYEEVTREVLGLIPIIKMSASLGVFLGGAASCASVANYTNICFDNLVNYFGPMYMENTENLLSVLQYNLGYSKKIDSSQINDICREALCVQALKKGSLDYFSDILTNLVSINGAMVFVFAFLYRRLPRSQSNNLPLNNEASSIPLKTIS